MKFTKEKLTKIYAGIKKLAFKASDKKNYAEALWHINNAAIVVFNFNWIFKDDEIENCLKEISLNVIQKEKQEYKPIKNKYIFYDQVGNNRVLGLQYLRAITSWDIELLYILEPCRHSIPDSIINEIQSYKKTSIYILPEKIEEQIEKAQELYNIIFNFQAEKVFFHSPAEGAFGVMLWNSLPNEIVRYRIVPGDHHYYLGTNITDYSIGFRSYGLAVDIQKRGYRQEQLLSLPFYPIIFNKDNFDGFPIEMKKDAIILFSGSALSKIYGSDIYFKIVKYLLDYDQRIILLFAGVGNTSKLTQFIKENNYDSRLFYLGHRNDIYELISRCHIYLGSYPCGGGLMIQYAALCKKPIIQFTKKINNEIIGHIDVESTLSYGEEGNLSISHTELDSLFQYAKALINDESYRIKEGERLYKRVIKEEEFNNQLYDIIYSKSIKKYNFNHISEENFNDTFNLYLNIENHWTHGCKQFLKNTYFILFPHLHLIIINKRWYYRMLKRFLKKFPGNTQ